MKNLIYTLFIVLCIQNIAFVSADTSEPDQKGFLAFSIKPETSEEMVINTETDDDQIEIILSEAEIEEGEPGCFYRYSYGMNIRGYGLSLTRVSCPNPNKYHLVDGGCTILGQGREYSSLSHTNLQYCSSQGIKPNGYHKVMAYAKCCSLDLE